MSMRRGLAAAFTIVQVGGLLAGIALAACSKSADGGGTTGTGGSNGSRTGGSGGALGGGSDATGGSGADAGSGGSGAGGAAGSGGTAGGEPTDGGGPEDAGSLGPDTASGSVDALAPIDAPADASVSTGPFALTSTVVQAKGTIDPKYRCGTPNVSPPLTWGPGPAGTLSYAVTLLHTTSVHWVLWDIPANVTSLPEGIARDAEPAFPPGSKQAKPNLDGATWFGYSGPCPQGAETHYEYNVYALPAAKLDGVTTASTATAVNAAILKIKALATAQLSVMAAK